jgi:hypothetical protein
VLSGRKKLYERDPKNLELDSLWKLQGGLIGRLMLVNIEIKERLRQPCAAKPACHLTAEQIDGFNVMLDHLLARRQAAADPVG